MTPPKQITNIMSRVRAICDYAREGVWEDNRRSRWINILKTVMLSIRCFLNGELQLRACALAFRTLLAIVPFIALLFVTSKAIGVQTEVKDALITHFPAQTTILTTLFGFVDTYFKKTPDGLFFIFSAVFLVWAFASLLSMMEKSFNRIWQVPRGRSVWRKISDYTAVFVILPSLLFISNGISLFMKTSFKTLLSPSLLQPTTKITLLITGLILTWFFFAWTYIMIPNVKVKFKNALLAGIIVGSAYQIIQWLFASGQVYVARYNALYGSFSFLPLLMIWLQLVWLFTLIGAVICYSSQNINEFNFGNRIKNMSPAYRKQILITVMTIIAKRFMSRQAPMTLMELSQNYNIPLNVLTPSVNKLAAAGLVNYIHASKRKDRMKTVQPAVDVSNLTAGDVFSAINTCGDSSFIPNFDKRYKSIIELYDTTNDTITKDCAPIKLIDINIEENQAQEQP